LRVLESFGGVELAVCSRRVVEDLREDLAQALSTL